MKVSNTHKLSLNGEIDKRGHKRFDGQNQKNPDFVFHIPGTMEGNTLIVEVKGTLSYPRQCYFDDFNTIMTFVSKYRYEAGIFVLYNHTYNDLLKTLSPELAKMANRPESDRVWILCISEPMKACEEHVLSELRG